MECGQKLEWKTERECVRVCVCVETIWKICHVVSQNKGLVFQRKILFLSNTPTLLLCVYMTNARVCVELLPLRTVVLQNET